MLAGIFLTHLHSDHVADLNNILSGGFYNGLQCVKKIPIWGPENPDVRVRTKARVRFVDPAGPALVSGDVGVLAVTLTPERAAEMVRRAASGVPQSLLASDYAISRETAYTRPVKLP